MFRNVCLILCFIWSATCADLPIWLKETNVKYSYMSTMAPIDTVITLTGKTKQEIMSIVRFAITQTFVSAETVTDNSDESLGLVQVKFRLKVDDYWGVPFMGSASNIDRGTSVNINIYIKDDRCKIQVVSFIPNSKGIVECHMRKKLEDWLSLRQQVINMLSESIVKSLQSTKNDWDF